MTTTIYEQMAEAVRRVAQARYELGAHKTDLADAQESFDHQHAPLIAKVEAAKQAVAEAEATARALAEAHFLVTKEKAPVPGIAVKERERLSYTDPDALAWAKETKLALVPETFDRKAFEKIAKATDIPFVVRIVEPMVTLASDLSAVLTAPET